MNTHTDSTRVEEPNNERFVTPARRTLMLLVVLGLVGFALFGML